MVSQGLARGLWRFVAHNHSLGGWRDVIEVMGITGGLFGGLIGFWPPLYIRVKSRRCGGPHECFYIKTAGRWRCLLCSDRCRHGNHLCHPSIICVRGDFSLLHPFLHVWHHGRLLFRILGALLQQGRVISAALLPAWRSRCFSVGCTPRRAALSWRQRVEAVAVWFGLTLLIDMALLICARSIFADLSFLSVLRTRLRYPFSSGRLLRHASIRSFAPDLWLHQEATKASGILHDARYGHGPTPRARACATRQWRQRTGHVAHGGAIFLLMPISMIVAPGLPTR